MGQRGGPKGLKARPDPSPTPRLSPEAQAASQSLHLKLNGARDFEGIKGQARPEIRRPTLAVTPRPSARDKGESETQTSTLKCATSQRQADSLTSGKAKN